MNPHTGSASSKEDLTWLTAVQNGDYNIYGELVIKYNKPLYFYIFKIVRDQEIVDDLVQETFLKAFFSIHSFNPEYAFSTWLYRIASNHCIDFLRKKKLIIHSLDRPIEGKEGGMIADIQDRDSETDREIIFKERCAIIEEAIGRLPEHYRQVIQKRHLEERSYKEISDILDRPIGTVKAHLFRGREMLNKHLKDKKSWL